MEVHVDPVETKPVQVIHTLNINFDSISNYCAKKCQAQSTDPTFVTTCTDNCYTNFLDLLSHGLTNAVQPGVPSGS